MTATIEAPPAAPPPPTEPAPHPSAVRRPHRRTHPMDATEDAAGGPLTRAQLDAAIVTLVRLDDVDDPTEGEIRDELAWQDRALCAQTDPEAFFPDKGGSTRAAKAVCLSCEVRVQCLDYALENDERFGIWGGLSERERRRVKKAAV